MRVVTLLENTAQDSRLRTGHGLSLWLETDRHRVLFDMGPNASFVENAKTLGIDLRQADLAVLSHGHYDHGGGLEAFCRLNDHATVYLREDAFGDFYAQSGEELRYIGLDPALKALEERFCRIGTEQVIDSQLTLFSTVRDTMGALAASRGLKEQTAQGLRPDGFSHEQNLLVEAEGKTVLFAGCAHMGIVNILEEAKARLGRLPDMVFGGFHFFQLDPEDPASGRLVDQVGQRLLAGSTVYYTGHCTGEFAYERLRGILGERLRRMSGGVIAEI